MEHPYLFIQIPGFEAYPHVTYTWMLMVLLAVVSFATTRSMHLVPLRLQNFFEVVVEGIADFMRDVIGPEGPKYMFLIGTLAIFILTSNLVGMIPGFTSPTNNLNTNAAMAITVFFIYHFIGIRKHGLAYVKHFTGPIIWLAPLLLPIELIGHFARILSLSVRLFGNIMGHDIILIILGVLAGLSAFIFWAPVPMIFMGIFVSFIQTFVFVLLSTIYIALALEEEH
ncbi:MAG: F0F1 ATP synthase subunit A [bacterium]|nr:F0F1 ATP synthase subunit A [bacterium]